MLLQILLTEASAAVATVSNKVVVGNARFTVLTDSLIRMEAGTFNDVPSLIFQTREEAIELANDTPYGLGASVWGAEDEAHAVAREMTAGMIGINRGCGGAAGTPWVGARQSGYGFHSSPEGHRQFAQVRVITTARRDR